MSDSNAAQAHAFACIPLHDIYSQPKLTFLRAHRGVRKDNARKQIGKALAFGSCVEALEGRVPIAVLHDASSDAPRGRRRGRVSTACCAGVGGGCSPGFSNYLISREICHTQRESGCRSTTKHKSIVREVVYSSVRQARCCAYVARLPHNPNPTHRFTFPAASLAQVCFPSSCGQMSSTLIMFMSVLCTPLSRVPRVFPAKRGLSAYNQPLTEGKADTSATNWARPLHMSMSLRL